MIYDAISDNPAADDYGDVDAVDHYDVYASADAAAADDEDDDADKDDYDDDKNDKNYDVHGHNYCNCEDNDIKSLCGTN